MPECLVLCARNAVRGLRARGPTSLAAVGVAVVLAAVPAAAPAQTGNDLLPLIGTRVRLGGDGPEWGLDPPRGPLMVGRISGVSRDTLHVDVAPGVVAAVAKGTPGLERSTGLMSRGRSASAGALLGAYTGIALGAFVYGVTRRAGSSVARDAAFTTAGACIAIDAVNGALHPRERWVPLTF